MREYKTVPTSAEVWSVIHARHRSELVVFGSFSDPDGRFNDGAGERGKMFTSYGFKSADFPIMEAETTWTINPESPPSRLDEKHLYWLCLPNKDSDA